ncbi:transporter substrate-binding domain-containing protein [Mesorhizobium sp. KR1-2]|uniref:transporter substrate-binding domain-containing protein n=1 Tax=Mesorhizobium sp. KR1-2 TaxID=3156609 RepID=UPI0032B3B5E7
MGNSIPIGLLFSRSGPYWAPGQQGFYGALAAIEAVNASGEYPFELVAHDADPEGNTGRYAGLCRDMIRRTGLRHVVGCTTSWSRKEVIPVVEKADALLWYPCVYEGFEASENVVYIAASPNQHLLPLLDYVVPRFGRNAFLTGSNYIWGWEMNRIAREVLHHSGGSVLGERYVPIGDVEIHHIVAEIKAKKPDFILNNLIGPSSYAFLKTYHELGLADPSFASAVRPVLSCNLYEGEGSLLGEAIAGHFTVSCYFQSLRTPANQAFLNAVAGQPGTEQVTSFFAQSYTSVFMIANAIRQAGTDAITEVLAQAKAHPFSAPFGKSIVDARTNHVLMPAHIGRARADGGFDVVFEAGGAIEPDPFLTRSRLGIPGGEALPSAKAPHLRVVQ